MEKIVKVYLQVELYQNKWLFKKKITVYLIFYFSFYMSESHRIIKEYF